MIVKSPYEDLISVQGSFLRRRDFFRLLMESIR